MCDLERVLKSVGAGLFESERETQFLSAYVCAREIEIERESERV